MIVKPFRGLRPRADLASRIPSPPYDVVTTEEARALGGDDPHSFLHVIRAEIDLDPGIDPYDDRVYTTARKNLQSMIDQGWLVRDAAPSYYVYRLEMDGQEQVGLVGAAAVDDYLADRIKKHEFTRPDKEADRVRVVDSLSAHPGPVFLTYRGLPELNALVAGVTADPAEVRFTAADGVEHAFWPVDDPALVQSIEDLFAKVPQTYVADGHHRAAAAAQVSARRRGLLEAPTGKEASNYFLAVHFPANQLRVLDYNRVVADLNGLEPAALLDRMHAAGFELASDHRAKKPPHPQSFGVYLDGRWHLLTARADIVPADDVVGRLDVSILTERLLQPVLGIGDPRTDKRIDFVGGIRGMEELERRVDSGRAAVAFALYPTALEQVMEVADSGRVMPPKSTWFEPKLRSGLVVQLIEGDL